MNLASAFASSSEKHGPKTAIFWGEAEVSYQHLLGQARQVCHWLREQFQVRPGARVGLWLKNSPEFASALFGVLFARGVVVPINNFLKPQEVTYILADAGIEVL